MGVPLLLTWLRRRFSECFSPAGGAASDHVRHADNLYIDLNSFLYQASAAEDGHGPSDGVATIEEVEERVIQRLFVLLDDVILSIVQPKLLVYLAVDGVSPLGKISQQRNRRLRHAARSRRGGAGSSHGQQLWDSNCISVGTTFMFKVVQALHYYAVSRTESVNLQRREQQLSGERESNDLLSIIVDDVLRPGEGETKITAAIRNFRSCSSYRPGSSHVICSSDTDTTVTSLLLHEPRIHVLRYEPLPIRSANAPPLTDSWQSTFFSIHLFREALRHRLKLSPQEGQTIVTSSSTSKHFEKCLHDIVFLLLLFGNDFLPSVSGSIQEGTLDALLQLLAEDFVPRQRYLVDAATNCINFDAARYLLDRLFAIRQGDRPSGGLSIFEGDQVAPPSSLGFDREPEHQQRKREEEKKTEHMCYSYWTMLQWALHYSAGAVPHWSCYYPYAAAPPLDKLAEYCGEVPYTALRPLSGASSHSISTPTNRTPDGRDCPTDALVQLLILLPFQSIALLPARLQQCYDEISTTVCLPIEEINFPQLTLWCDAKRKLMSDAERTRFRAYQFFSSPTQISGVPASTAAFLSSDAVFVALWSCTEAAKEREADKAAVLEETQAATAGSNPSVSVAKAMNFFSGKRSVSAAAAAIRGAAPQQPAPVSPPTIPHQEKKGEEEKPQSSSVEVVEQPSYRLTTAGTEVMEDDGLQRALGEIYGASLSTEHYTPRGSSHQTLSRYRHNHQLRLMWRLAVSTVGTLSGHPQDLLPGVVLPCEGVAAAPGSKSAKRQREEEGDGESLVSSVEERKEALRRRLGALKAGKPSA